MAKRSSVASDILEGLTLVAKTLENRRAGVRPAEALRRHFTVRQIKLDLKPKAYVARDVKLVRKKLGASQAVFAQLLGVSTNTVRAWEQGVNPPTRMASRFMDEIRLHPNYWLGRLREAAIEK